MLKHQNDHVIDFRYAPKLQQTMICYPYDDIKTVVREDGSLNHLYELGREVFIDGTEPPCARRIVSNQEGNHAWKYRFVPRFYHNDTLISRTQDFGDPRMAIITTVEDYEHCVFRWTVFAHRDPGGSRIDIMICTLNAKENFGHASDQIYIQCLGDDPLPSNVMPPPLRHHDVLPRAREWRPAPSVQYTPVYRQNGVEINEPIAYLNAGEVWECAFGFVYGGVYSVKFDEKAFTMEYAKNALEACKEYWLECPIMKKTIHLPDKNLQAMLIASARNVLQAAEILEAYPRIRIGPTIYRGFWIADTNDMSNALYMIGQDELARGGLYETLGKRKPDGSILYIDGLFSETTSAIGTIIRHAELTNNNKLIIDQWPVIVDACNFLRDLNRKTLEMGEEYPGFGLLPPAFGDGGLFGDEAEFATPGRVTKQLSQVWQVGERLCLDGWEEIKELCETIKKNGRAKMEKYMKTTDDGIKYLPASMQYDPRHKPSLSPGVFLPFIENDDPLWEEYFKLLDKYDDTQGIPECTGWRSDQSVFSYACASFVENLVRHGMPEKAIDYIYAFCNHATAGRVWREEQPFTDSTCNEACGDMPHTRAGTYLITMVRRCLIDERGDSLYLLPALANEWLPTDQDNLELFESPTRFGYVSIKLEKETEFYKLNLSFEDGAVKPKDIKFCWRGKILEASCVLTDAGDGFWDIPVEAKKITLKLSCN